MFSKKDFQTWGKQNAILFAAVMTKIEGRKDDALLRTYEFRGFPSMAILDADGTAMTKKVPRDLYSMSNIVAAAPAYAKLSAAIEAGNEVDRDSGAKGRPPRRRTRGPGRRPLGGCASRASPVQLFLTVAGR